MSRAEATRVSAPNRGLPAPVARADSVAEREAEQLARGVGGADHPVRATPTGRHPGRPAGELVRATLAEPGEALAPAQRATLEQGFGHDFSRVRVHTGERAQASALALGAQAYTFGRDVVLGQGGAGALAHELAHVVQYERGQSPMILRRSFWEQLAGLFADDKYSDQELTAYLSTITSNNAIEDYTDSDNKARAVVNAMLDDPFSITLTPRQKVLLIQEMQSGYTGGEDERAILTLLTSSSESDLAGMFGPGGLDVKALLDDFQGGEKTELKAFLDNRFEGGLEALQKGTVTVLPLMSPHERMVVARAKKRLKLLHQYVDEWSVREIRRSKGNQEREEMLTRRKGMDQDDESSRRGVEELTRVPGINQKPLRIEVTEDEVIFHVRFQVRFEDEKMKTRFTDLSQSLQSGIRSTWNQRLLGKLFLGKTFGIDPTIVLTSGTAERDTNFWLVTVRPNDTAQPVFPGCSFDPIPAAPPTSVTDPGCSGGVMSIPPLHIERPDVLAHEMLHLFGFYDRYVMLEQKAAPGAPTTAVQTVPMRETKGRKDPLGGESGKVLEEDIAFLFDRFGVYEMEESRGLEVLRQLESQGLGINLVIGEIHRLEEIVRTGHDPDSLLPIRKDFNQEMFKNAEDL